MHAPRKVEIIHCMNTDLACCSHYGSGYQYKLQPSREGNTYLALFALSVNVCQDTSCGMEFWLS